jgi:hypothetical protein
MTNESHANLYRPWVMIGCRPLSEDAKKNRLGWDWFNSSVVPCQFHVIIKQKFQLSSNSLKVIQMDTTKSY